MRETCLKSRMLIVSILLCGSMLLSTAIISFSQPREQPAKYKITLKNGRTLQAVNVQKSGEYYEVTLTTGKVIQIKISEATVTRISTTESGTSDQSDHSVRPDNQPGHSGTTDMQKNLDTSIEGRVLRLEKQMNTQVDQNLASRVAELEAQVAELLEIIEIQNYKVVLDTHGRRLEIKSDLDVSIRSDMGMKIQSQLNLELKGVTQATLESDAVAKVVGSSMTTIDGGIIKLNKGKRAVAYMNGQIAGNIIVTGSPTVLVP